MNPDDLRPFRWWGDPTSDTQPDVGDILVLRDSNPEEYRLVHAARPIRGGHPSDLMLTVTTARIRDDGTIPEDVYDRIVNAGVFYYTPARRRPTRNGGTPHDATRH